MAKSKSAVLELIKEQLMPAFLKERERLDRIDKWLRWEHERPHMPRHSTREYKELAARAPTPWLSSVVTAATQGLYVGGYRRSDDGENAEPWRWWQANKMDGRQVALHRATLGYGHAYTSTLPGLNAFGMKIPVIKGHSPRHMITFYDEPAHDDYPHYAMRAEPAKVEGSTGWAIRVYDDMQVHFLNSDSGGTKLTYIEAQDHNLGLCPVVRYCNSLDLEGRTPGDVEPFIPLAGRIDQTVFDRLVVQRFASWKVRVITGLAADEQVEVTGESVEKIKQRLRTEDILLLEEPNATATTLDATELDGFIRAKEADLKDLAAVTQTPSYELMGQLANLSAEALAAARSSLTARIYERKKPLGESHNQTLQLAAWVMGDREGARDDEAQVRWEDTEIRSLAQAADALGKLAKMLGVPVEVLWEKIPGFTEQDVQRAKAITEQGGALGDLTRLLQEQDLEPSLNGNAGS